MNLSLFFSEILLLPWVSAALIAIFIKNKTVLIPWFSIGSSIILLILTFLFVSNSNPVNDLDLNWFSIGQKAIHARFHMDYISKAMLCLVALIACLVQIFSKSYMEKDVHINRYYLFLQLFVGSMIGLLLADQVWMFYGFWELVGACSFFIISFWHQKDSAVKAAKKAFILNRIGDLALLIGLFLLAEHFQTDRFSSMNIAKEGPISLLLGIIFVIGASGKSAQFPLMSWLPDAMEGPTPASALIHAATMVTAGVFLALRIYPISGEETHLAFGFIGGISFLSASIFAIRQSDIKKTLAYSTISQIGLMWMGLGSDASLFHLITHGIFKAGLFLTAGSIIYYLHEQDQEHQIDAQNVQQMGGLFRKIPILATLYVIFSFGLIGLPLSNGFYSKENIAAYLIEQSKDSAFENSYYILLGILAIGILFSTFYMSRQVLQIFGGTHRSSLSLQKGKIQFFQFLPLLLLGLASFWFFINLNPLEIQGSKLLQLSQLQIYESPVIWLYVSITLWAIGMIIAYLTRHQLATTNFQFFRWFWPSLNKTGIGFAQFVHKQIDQKIDSFIHFSTKCQVILAHCISWIDRWLVDGLLVKMSTWISSRLGSFLEKWQSGKVQSYWAWLTITFGRFLLYYLL